ncbi:MAG: hypothetical protein PHO07_11165 [Pirellulales bacterium]|jgi:CubicO group peptidase (beta-lactamase class C family)|nr:hypothetical protein [Thermoguttaceae bacterium]MDD4787726.1 hypothetical protein [Pirellulales bacterium]NLY99481.1 beta-lactamase family protein [Pirellulaceae bacterium]
MVKSSGKRPSEESIRRYGNIVTPPGERYRYSNFAYGILDHLLARTPAGPDRTVRRRPAASHSAMVERT